MPTFDTGWCLISHFYQVKKNPDLVYEVHSQKHLCSEHKIIQK